MDTKLAYLDDNYLKETTGKVIFNEFTDLIVDNSVFFPTGEGQPNDRGKIVIEGKEYEIIDTWNDGTGVHLISHDTYPENIKGKDVKQYIDWPVRYGHMKFRTALRIITGIAYRDFKAANRINQTYDDQAWVDLEIPEINEEIVKKIETETNDIIKKGVNIVFTYKDRSAILSDNDLMTISRGNIPDFPKIRLVKIGELPYQIDHGTHVKNTSEVGTVNFKTTLIKGKVSKRVIITLA